jgi:hypothetical protein
MQSNNLGLGSSITLKTGNPAIYHLLSVIIREIRGQRFHSSEAISLA